MWSTKVEVKKLKDIIEEEISKEVNKKLETITEPTVFFNETTKQRCKVLCKLLPDSEWMAGLVGRKEDGNYYIDDLLLIEQEVTGCHVNATKDGLRKLHNTESIVGWIHSHNNMSSFQSGTDEDTAINFPLSITVNNDLEFFGTSKEKVNIFDKEVETFMEVDIEMPEDEESEFEAEMKKEVELLVKEKEYNFGNGISSIVEEGQRTLSNKEIEDDYWKDRYDKQYRGSDIDTGSIWDMED